MCQLDWRARGDSCPQHALAFGQRDKGEFLRCEEAERVAIVSGVDLRTVTGQRGHIGSLVAIGWYDMGAIAATLPSDLE